MDYNYGKTATITYSLTYRGFFHKAVLIISGTLLAVFFLFEFVRVLGHRWDCTDAAALGATVQRTSLLGACTYITPDGEHRPVREFLIKYYTKAS